MQMQFAIIPCCFAME